MMRQVYLQQNTAIYYEKSTKYSQLLIIRQTSAQGLAIITSSLYYYEINMQHFCIDYILFIVVRDS